MTVPRLQLKSGPAPTRLHEPWDGLIVPWLKPTGQAAVRVTPVASDGPALLIVYR
jgi:hypothetical protein